MRAKHIGKMELFLETSARRSRANARAEGVQYNYARNKIKVYSRSKDAKSWKIICNMTRRNREENGEVRGRRKASLIERYRGTFIGISRVRSRVKHGNYFTEVINIRLDK